MKKPWFYFKEIVVSNNHSNKTKFHLCRHEYCAVLKKYRILKERHYSNPDDFNSYNSYYFYES